MGLLAPRALLVAALAAQALADRGAETTAIAEALALQGGEQVADVGAGDGEYSQDLADRVGARGHVIATEVDDDKLARIRARVESAGLHNVSTVRGDQEGSGLPAGCCDAILLRLVYHHFTDPAAMRKSLWSALRPGGRIAVVEVPPQKGWRHLEGVPERGGHGIAATELIGDMRSSGFEVVTHHAVWPAENDAYCVVFRRPG